VQDSCCLKGKPGSPQPQQLHGSGSKQKKIRQETLQKINILLGKTPTITAKDFKRKMPELENVSACIIQQNCQKDTTPCRPGKWPKTLLSQPVVMTVRLDFARRFKNYTSMTHLFSSMTGSMPRGQNCDK
jgi:hypothetical protein